MVESTTPPLQNFVVADRYRVERLLGQGGMGSVWAGRHTSLGQTVAIKFLHRKLLSSREALRRFDIEAKAAARIKSRHAVAVHDHGVTADGQPFLVMEYLDGETLQERLSREGRLALDEVVYIVTQAGRALEVAHAAGVVHRDLKPDNVFLARDPDAERFGYTVKLVDFGIAKIIHDEAAVGAAATQAGMVLGTPHYMSPEALTGSAPVTVASDLWSLSACAFAAVCGFVPFGGDAIGDVVLKVCAAPLPVPSKSNSSLPRAFDAWFARGCARDPSRRFASISEMVQALGRLRDAPGGATDAQAYELVRTTPSSLEDDDLALPQGPGRGRVLAAALAGAALTLGGLGFYVMQRTRAANEAIQRSAEAAAALRAPRQAASREPAEAREAASGDAGPRESPAPGPAGLGAPAGARGSARD